MRWLITGAGGMLGRDLHAVLGSPTPTSPTPTSPTPTSAAPTSPTPTSAAPTSATSTDSRLEVIATTRAELDITDPAAVRDAVAGADVVFNTAAWTDVDGAETSPGAAAAVNAEAVRVLAAAAGPRLIHFSTDYVFDGTATSPYAEDTPYAPVNAYGRTKAAGERAVLAAGGYVIRTAWLYGAHGPNFVRTMLRLAAERDTLTVVNDQQGQPTWSYALAQQSVALAHAALADRAPAGAYHGTAAGSTTWHGLAQAVFTEAGLDPARVLPTTSDRFPRPAPRPSYSVLGHDRWSTTPVSPLPHWRTMLKEAFPTLRP
ncbi:dTDP-4-dehydrorhamnose reductase [Actinoplanes sp. NBRC 101535]|uniref:dTDP-4-dehydrorhamnose reductase n=1 Tax=Actinoplanes sp. NBRC 101535 TaxID=3032196 RepID=UPI00249FB5AB|nr:dTDP-4-dehydrorhamnose reductase [Actinoplanes sp. NBRC 101535]GLY05262.1 NAD(P)-dependent oxidoreductase [Actinoplanes sp. NBRC 101535]